MPLACMRFWVARMRWAASLGLSIASSKTESSLVTWEVYEATAQFQPPTSGEKQAEREWEEKRTG